MPWVVLHPLATPPSSNQVLKAPASFLLSFFGSESKRHRYCLLSTEQRGPLPKTKALRQWAENRQSWARLNSIHIIFFFSLSHTKYTGLKSPTHTSSEREREVERTSAQRQNISNSILGLLKLSLIWNYFDSLIILPFLWWFWVSLIQFFNFRSKGFTSRNGDQCCDVSAGAF